MLPRRLGARFALEALFLVALALGAGLAELRPLLIVLVMGVAWLLVALAELTAERMERSPLSYLLPRGPTVAEDEPDQVFGPPPEERTVVEPPVRAEPKAEQEEASPEPEAEPPEPEPAAEHPPTPEPVPEPPPEPEPVPEPEPLPPPEPTASIERSVASRFRARLRRKEPEPEPPAPITPRHVKLLPRRTAEEPSRAAQEVAKLFGPQSGDADDTTPSEEANT